MRYNGKKNTKYHTMRTIPKSLTHIYTTAYFPVY